VASFPPWKAYILSCLDEFVATHRLVGPFLDVGCGDGDVAAHLAARGWSGTALDSSASAQARARATLRAYPQIRVAGDELAAQPRAHFATAILLDVLEHVEDDAGTLAAVAATQPLGGHLVLTVPTHEAREWRWDDDVYGHLRRYAPDALAALLSAHGYEPVETWDISLPFIWAMRRAYTALKRPPVLTTTPAERTSKSAATQAWELGAISRVLSWTPLWRPAFVVQRAFRRRVASGCEVMVLARRVR
jgi:SAM-dependent methyltransferase